MRARQDMNKDITSSNLEITSNRKSKYGNFGQKTLKFGTFLSATWCHGDCHTGTETSHGVLKLETRVRRTHTQFQRALDGPQRSSGGRDRQIFHAGTLEPFGAKWGKKEK